MHKNKNTRISGRKIASAFGAVSYTHLIVSVVKERNISDIVMGMHHDRTPGGSGIGRMAADLLGYSNVTTFFYHPEQPLTTVKRHLVIVPEKAEKEAGFQLWMQKLRNLAENSSARIVFYAPASTCLLYTSRCV